MTNIEQLSINTIRLLAADTVQKANSGHPGLPLGAAAMAYAVWAKQMVHNPKNPNWQNRDRFVLSAGHGSSLIYSLLYLFRYGLSIEDLQNFRQYDSKTPGHPEYGHTTGVEVTTGPLGQGIANAVGMAWAESYLATQFNRQNFPIIDHFTFCICGDGCLQEGISSEASSLAGTLGLGKLVLLYDSNNITIEGDTKISFTEDVLKRYEAYNWHTQRIVDGNNVNDILNAIEAAKAESDRPSIIEIKTTIGFGSPNKAGKASAHGEPLGVGELAATKTALGFNPNEFFHVPNEVESHINEILIDATKKEEIWNNLVDNYKEKYPIDYKNLQAWYDGTLPNLLENDDFWSYEGNLATRISSEKVLNKLTQYIPNLFGGSADLAPSTKTIMADKQSYSFENKAGANLHFGVREHAMSAIASGIALHGGLRPYVASFFVFSDYMKPALRLSALMKLPVINIFTHDSIGVGEDGPTHQPIEQLAALRSIPNFTVIRPCDSNEVAAAWYLALTRKDSPTALILSRQNLTLLSENSKSALKGAYILKDSKKSTPDIILMASGSEVELIYKAHEVLAEKGIDARVVSMPSWEVFEEQSDKYKESILPKNVRARLAVEAASGFGWEKYTGIDGDSITISGFGNSGNYQDMFKNYGFTIENVLQKAIKLIS